MHVRFGPGATGKGPADGGHLASGLPVHKHVGVGQIIVRIFRDVCEPLTVIEVQDEGAALPVVRDQDHGATSGRGLLLMAQLVHDWGVRPLDGEGKITWARCAR
ncbi:hypothetical protein GCM10009736_60290 [Actinomadura bangladeshensis]